MQGLRLTEVKSKASTAIWASHVKVPAGWEARQATLGIYMRCKKAESKRCKTNRGEKVH